MSTYSYDFVKKLSFTRPAGSPEAKKAAEMIMEEIASLGGTSVYEPFKIPACRFHKYGAKILAPYEKEIEVLPYGCSGSLPEGGVNLKFLYAEEGKPEDFLGIGDLSDTVVMLNALSLDAYKILCEKHAAAFMTISNKHYHNKDNHDLVYRPLRDRMLAFGKIPGFMVWAHDATEMVRDHVESIHLELISEDYEADCGNVVATIPGTEITNESMVVTAHYDSLTVGTGAWDNATGSATIMYIYRHFLKNAPRRTMHFIWCDAEELGLLGSKAYVAQHEDLIKDEIRFCFNFDMCGTILGPSSVKVTGRESLMSYAEQFCKEMGHSARITRSVHSSDSAPFADKGVPSISLSRRSTTADIHNRYDVIFPLSAEQLKKDGDIAVAFISRVIGSRVLPEPMGMPDDILKELDRYFGRK